MFTEFNQKDKPDSLSNKFRNMRINIVSMKTPQTILKEILKIDWKKALSLFNEKIEKFKEFKKPEILEYSGFWIKENLKTIIYKLEEIKSDIKTN
jgi:hypothetical protein